MRPLDGYIRVSRVAGREGEQFIAPDVQRERIEGYAKAKHLEIGTWHEDLDVSGGGLKRPGLDEAMERIRLGVSGGLIVARLDRLSRAGVGDALKLVEEIHEHGAQLVAIDLNIDTTTETGELMLTLMLALGRMERRRIQAGWREAQERAIERGVYIASKAPTGYDHENGRLVPNEHADAIRDLFTLRAAGASWRDCCKFLDDQGVVGPWGKSLWKGRAVQGIIANRAYLGESRFGDLFKKEAHKPLTDAQTWKAAQRAPIASTPRSRKGALLSGFIRCAGCRYLMKPSTRTHLGEKVRIYECGKTYAMGKCPRPTTVLGRVIEPFVIDHFKEMVGSPQFVNEEHTDELVKLYSDLADAEAALDEFSTDGRLQTALGIDRFAEGVESRMAELRALDTKVEELQRIQSIQPGRIDFDELFDTGSIDEKRALLQSLIGAVFVRSVGKKAPIRQRAIILGHSELPEDLPRRGRRVPIASFAFPSDPPR